MNSIDFFTPVIYDRETKTISEQSLEVVDEYFNLGTRFRVRVFDPTEHQKTAWAIRSHRDCCRSWSDIAIKVVSYCTIILPVIALLAKLKLRSDLNMHSLTLIVRKDPKPHSIKDISIDVLKNIISYLPDEDLVSFSKVSRFTRDLERDWRTPHLNPTLKREIQEFPEDLPVLIFQKYLIRLINSSAMGHPQYNYRWTRVMNDLIAHWIFQEKTPTFQLVPSHRSLAHLLQTSTGLFSPNQLYLFCKYLGSNQLFETRPYIHYLIFEQYRQLHPKMVDKACTEQLTHQARILIKAEDKELDLSYPKILRLQEVVIDPSVWFGWNGREANDCEWIVRAGPQNVIPKLLLDVLLERILDLQSSCKGKPLVVTLTGSEVKMPGNFAVNLVVEITKARIFLNQYIATPSYDKYGEIHIGPLRNAGGDPAYLLPNEGLNRERETELTQEYPNAVVIRRKK